MEYKWPTLLAEPEYARLIDANSRKLLNALESLLGLPGGNDRYVRMAEFLRMGEKDGLLTGQEHFNLRSIIGPQM